MPNSKSLGKNDQSGFDFVQEMLQGDETYGINFDRVQWDSKNNKYIIVELLLCEEEQIVTPYTSHPNRYFFSNYSRGIKGNAQKFISLWQLSEELKANLYLVNYAKKGTKHEDQVLLMWVKNVDKNNKKCPVSTVDKKLTRKEFSKKFREMNRRGNRD
ncbi:MAG: hypothetical protein HRT87_06315 [Legionellales bacterium]|nr:hypothetical protein [Legionellales bacterium]